MKQIRIADTTLLSADGALSFKERIEIARQLEKLNVDAIELPEITNAKTDSLLVRTVSSFVKGSVLSVGAGMAMGSVALAAAALSGAAHPRIRIELPVSPVGMEYACHKKAPKMIEWIAACVAEAKQACPDVELCAVDATRAEREVLEAALQAAIGAGATSVTLCDSAAEMMPDDFAAFAGEIAKRISVPVYVRCNDKNGMAAASAALAVRAGVDGVKTAVLGEAVSLEAFVDMIKNCGNTYGLCTAVRATELHRNVKQIRWIIDGAKSEKLVLSPAAEQAEIRLDANDGREAVDAAAVQLGYDLSEEDRAKVYEEFCRVSRNRQVGSKELEAVIASVALQVPATYQIKAYVVNNGNVISSTAQITMEKNGETMQGISIGDGPIDAAFRAIEQIVGHRYELDDFQIQAVTEGKEAMGSALVKLRADGKLYSGNGISTDIIGASIRAYINAINKIVYEEVQA